MKNTKSIRSLFSLPGFVAASRSSGVFGDRYARVIKLRRRKTALCSHCGHRCQGRCDKRVLQVRDLPVAGWWIYREFERWRVNCPRCNRVHVEHPDWLVKNPRYAPHVIRRTQRPYACSRSISGGPGRYDTWNRRGVCRWPDRRCCDRFACLPET
jgi:hypothetical protein